MELLSRVRIPIATHEFGKKIVSFIRSYFLFAKFSVPRSSASRDYIKEQNVTIFLACARMGAPTNFAKKLNIIVILRLELK